MNCEIVIRNCRFAGVQIIIFFRVTNFFKSKIKCRAMGGGGLPK